MESAALFQRTIKENSDDLHAFLADINSWEDEIKRKDELLSKQKPILKKTLPPVRNKSTKNKQDKMNSGKNSDTRKSTRINSYDYRAWDQFDVEQACEDSDEGAGESSSEYEEEDESRSEEYIQEQNQQKAVIEKEKGNLLFSQHKYEAAIERYTQAIALDPTNAVLPANRAMALLKMDRFAAAEQDCTNALSIDPTYTKALFRRATARMRLNKLQDAAHDFNELLKYEPENKKAKAELVRINSMTTDKVSKNRSEQQQLQGEQQGLVFPITRPLYMRSKKPLKTVVIEEISSGASPAAGKAPPPTLNTTSAVIKDDTLSVPVGSAVTTTGKSSAVEGSTTTAEVVNNVTNTVENSPAKVKGNSTAVKGESNTVREPPAKQDTPINPVVTTPKLPPVPSSSITFLHDWKRLQAYRDLKSQYFQLLPVDKYPTILSQCLETDVFPDIINILYNSYVKCGRPCIKELQALTRVQRFSMAMMFLSSKDKSTLHEIFSELKSLAKDDDKPILQQLAKTYKVSL